MHIADTTLRSCSHFRPASCAGHRGHAAVSAEAFKDLSDTMQLPYDPALDPDTADHAPGVAPVQFLLGGAAYLRVTSCQLKHIVSLL